MEKRTLSYFASDVHLGLNVKDAADREARFVKFLNDIPAEKTEALYLLGDIWDFWYEYRDVVPMGYVKVFSALVSLIESGVKVFFFPGNHDLWCYRYFESLGMTVVRDRYMVTTIGEQTFCMAHGDGLGRGMRGYKFLRSIFHNRFFQAMFGIVHPRIAFAIGRRWSRHSRLAKNCHYAFRGKDEPIYAWAKEFSEQAHVDCFIFGHFHCSVDETLPSGARLMILKDWIDDSPYFLFDRKSGIVGNFPKIEK